VAAAAPARRAAPGGSGIARISAPALGLDHYIEVVGVVAGQMQSPVDGVYAVGWYPAFSAPGQPGNAVFSAHETWNRQRGPFYSLRSASAGTEITIQMTDGRSFRYQVMTNRRYALADMPMGEILWPSGRGAAESWITLITCGGRIVYDATGFGEYLDRDVVVARLVG
jgi:sortase (surface protein transpeptidase)